MPAQRWGPSCEHIRSCMTPCHTHLSSSIFRAFYALFIPYFYVQQYALFENVSPNLAKYLLPIINAMGIPARILPGLFADRVGP